MSESMIDRVARALHARRYGEWYEGPLKMTDSQRACLADARAAIEAMREPTEYMQKAGFRLNKWTNPKPCHDHCVGRVTMPVDAPWRAMIDAALNENANAR